MPTNLPTVPTGITKSALQHQFVVQVEGTPPTFTQQTCAFAMNFAKQELCMLVEQSLTTQTREHVVIQDIIDHPGRLITFDIVDSKGNIVDTIKFVDCKIEDHTIDFNYGSVKSAIHVLLMSYVKIDLGAGKAQAAYANAMSIVGKP